MIDEKDLVDGFKKLSGDFVLVHSSFKSLGEVDGGPQVVIDALLECIGKNGTLLMPTYNWDFSDGVNNSYDVLNTPSKTGILNEIVRKNPHSKRTMDPVYSFAILGKLRDGLYDLTYESSYGKDSMFAKLRELKGKIMVIGVENYNRWMTFFHHCEEMSNVNYRYLKTFHGNITGYDRKTIPGKIAFYVRNLEMGAQTELNKMGKILEDKKIIKMQKIGNSIAKFMDANEVYARTLKEISNNPYILCKFEKNN